MQASRYRIVLGGAVQGAGLRPFVYRLAQGLSLAGYVRNSSDGLVIEVEGDVERLDRFAARLASERPAAALVTRQELSHIAPLGATEFVIAASQSAAAHHTGMLNDLATCDACLRELFDPADRRYQYPFANCTNCGPRFTISEALPYDRHTTTMREFVMCDACRLEYDTPSDRRYHAQPNACATCGPGLSRSIRDVADAIRHGLVVALKGIGGYHLLCDAAADSVVARLRERKARDGKPFAVMMPSLDAARRHCLIDEHEAEALVSAAAPIVLLRPAPGCALSPRVGGRAPFVGAMLPYSPLHHLLMRELDWPIVATSGNLSGEPIAFEDDDAHARLSAVADLIVSHTRPIARPCDDSVVRVTAAGPSLLRRARGYAPLPIRTSIDFPKVLAVGGHLKNTIAIGLGRDAIVSQHLGDLDTAPARRAFEAAIDDLCRAYRFVPEYVVADRHPDYASRQWADACGLKVLAVQHHHAHVAACAAEHGLGGRYLGVAWDGAGLGDDGAIWGGEFFAVDQGRFDRVAQLRSFQLVGGDAAAREGGRVLLAMDWIGQGRAALDGRSDAAAIERMLVRGLNAPTTTSVGRLFDAVAALIGVSDRNTFEGESALALEAAIDPRHLGTYPMGDGLNGDWQPLLDAIRADLRHGESVGAIAARFHRALVDWICRVAARLQVADVVLSGGVFQNAFLTDHAVAELGSRGHSVHTHRRVPANDGGLSLGQLAVAASR